MSTRRELLVLGAAASLLPLGSRLVEAAGADPYVDNFNNAWLAFNQRYWDDSTTPQGQISLYSCLDADAIYYKIKNGGPVGGPNNGGRNAVIQAMKQGVAADIEFFVPFTTSHQGPNISGFAIWIDNGTARQVRYHMQCQNGPLLSSLFATP